MKTFKASTAKNTTLQKRELGSIYEQKAFEYLSKQGYEILKRNLNYRWGELDLVVFDVQASELVFVEVRMRGEGQSIKAEETLSHSKRQRLKKAMKTYLNDGRELTMVREPRGIRFDLIAYDGERLTHWKNFWSVTDY